MSALGNYALWFGIVLALASALLLFISAITKKASLGSLGRALYLLFFLDVLFISGLLLYSLVTADYSLAYVQRHVANDLSLFYRISALWGGQAGSLIFWILVLSIYGAIVCFKEKQEGIWVQATLAIVSAFFITLTIESNAFWPAARFATDGSGLNPLLRNFWMIFHPPAVYLGYVGSAVPLAYLIGAYTNRKKEDDFIKKARIWALFSWAFLGLGIFLGARWAYVELGWGGYWAWDPVENASLIPWFFGTALVHAVMIQKARKHSFRRWGLLSGFLFFFMSLVGTFITRSGVIQSVHAFGFSKIAYYFYVFMALMLVYIVVFAVLLWKKIAPDQRAGGLYNRENLLSLANWVLYILGFGVLVMTLMPGIVWGKNLDAKVFDAATAPLAILFVLLMGLALIAPWAKVKANLKRFWWVLGLSVVSVPLWYIAGIHHPYGLLGAWAAGFLGWASLWMLFLSLRRFYLPTVGAHLAHLGIAITAMGIVGSHGDIMIQVPYKVGEEARLGEFTLSMGGLREHIMAAKHEITEARITVFKGEKQIGALKPTSVLFKGWERMGRFTDVDIIPRIWGDIYSALYYSDETGYTLLARRVPLIQWIWIGCWILFAGSIIPVFTRRRKT